MELEDERDAADALTRAGERLTGLLTIEDERNDRLAQDLNQTYLKLVVVSDERDRLRAERDAAVDALAAVQAEVHRIALDSLADGEET